MTDPNQLGRSALGAMTPEQVVEAHRAGRFNDFLDGRDPDLITAPSSTGDEPAGDELAGGDPDFGAHTPVVTGAPITSRAELRKMTPAEIVAARREGRLDGLTRGDHGRTWK